MLAVQYFIRIASSFRILFAYEVFPENNVEYQHSVIELRMAKKQGRPFRNQFKSETN